MLMLENDDAVGKVFNCGTGMPTCIDDLAKNIIDLYGASSCDFEPSSTRSARTTSRTAKPTSRSRRKSSATGQKLAWPRVK